MRKFLVLPDGTEYEVPSLTYNEFVALELWDIATDMAYADWLHINGYTDPQDLNEETLATAVLVLKEDNNFNIKFRLNEQVKFYKDVSECSIENQQRLNRQAVEMSEWNEKMGIKPVTAPLVRCYSDGET